MSPSSATDPDSTTTRLQNGGDTQAHQADEQRSAPGRVGLHGAVDLVAGIVGVTAHHLRQAMTHAAGPSSAVIVVVINIVVVMVTMIVIVIATLVVGVVAIMVASRVRHRA